MKIDRSRFFRPLRDIMNYIVYKGYVKQFDIETEEGRKWLYQLDRNIELMGYNEGIESFETHYEFEKQIGRKVVQNKLKRDVQLIDHHERSRRLELIQAKSRAEQVAKEQKEKEAKKRALGKRKPFDSKWKPTENNLIFRTPCRTENKYLDVVRREYDVPEYGAYVVTFTIKGKLKEIFHGENSLEVIHKASVFERDYVLSNQIVRVDPERTKQIRERRSDEYDIDISHVNRAMGNTGNNNDNSSSSSTDLDDFLNGLF